jgi:hypothetical protein
MDSNAAAKLQRPPPHADDDELPAPAPPEGCGRQRTLTGTRLRAIAALALAARFMVHTIINLLMFYSSSVTPCALFMFMWVKSGDQVYIKVQKEEESDEEKQYQVLRCDL